MTAALVLGGGLILFLIKIIDGSLFTSADPWYWILWESLFYASARTAGFIISDMSLISAAYALSPSKNREARSSIQNPPAQAV